MDVCKNYIKILEENKDNPKVLWGTMNKILDFSSKIPEINENIIKKKLPLLINVCINFLESFEDPNFAKSNKLTITLEEYIIKEGNKVIKTLKEFFDAIAGKKITSLDPMFYQKITRTVNPMYKGSHLLCTSICFI